MVLSGMSALHSRALVANGDREAGLAGLDEVWRLCELADELSGWDPGFVATSWEVLHLIASYSQDDDLARLRLAQADALHADRMVGTQFEVECWEILGEELLALRARLGFTNPE